MRVYQHSSYDEYKDANIHLNKQKLDRSISKDRIDPISNYIKKNIENIKYGICHGVRNGREVEIFKKNLKCDVIGTDISPTAAKFKDCIEWDFHNVKPEWINKFDFIYSNALDHSHSPQYCLCQWISCLNKNGYLIIEWSKKIGHVNNGDPNAADCFSANLEEFKSMLDSINLRYLHDGDFFILKKQEVDRSLVKNKYE